MDTDDESLLTIISTSGMFVCNNVVSFKEWKNIYNFKRRLDTKSSNRVVNHVYIFTRVRAII